MAINLSRIWLPGLLFVLTLASGFWLLHAGRPINTLIVTIHKLIALAATLLAGIAMAGLLRGAALPAPLLALLIIAALGTLSLFATGAFLSRPGPANRALLALHRIAPVVAVLAAAGVLVLLATP